MRRWVFLVFASLVANVSTLRAAGTSAEQEKRLEAYLSATYPAAVTSVEVTTAQIVIRGRVNKTDKALHLTEVPTWSDVTDLATSATLLPIAANPAGAFEIKVERQSPIDGMPHDRLLSRWAVVKPEAGRLRLMSSARWADKFPAPAGAPAAGVLKSKKGIGGFHAGKLQTDLDELNIGAVTVNVVLSPLLALEPGPGRTKFEYAGRTWWSNDRFVAGLDQTMLQAARRKAVVSAILLVPLGQKAPAGSFAKAIAHPDAETTAHFAMPNFTTREGTESYAAALAFLASRYSRPDGKFGRIHHYIVHNEVDAGWEWTNAGDKPIRVYLELYQRSMRATHLIARQYDPNAKAFISLTHHWTAKSGKHGYPSRDLLDLLLSFCKAEGDFEWAIAHHPYPQDLRNPRTWEDKQAKFSLDTPKITFRNLEVLDAWVKQPRAMYLGKQPRTIHLSEQGLNSPDYSEKSLRDQAAGMAVAWSKVSRLKSIEAFQYHNWVDNRREGGLRIGLRRFSDDETEPLGKKPIWLLYQALGTAKEEEAMAAYLATVGVTSWEQIMHSEPIK